MAEMVGSAVVQEVMSRVISYVLDRREEKASQGHIMERLEMAASYMELALERSAKMPFTDVSLLQRRKMIKRVYVEAMDLLGKNKDHHQVVQEECSQAQGVKRKRSWIAVFGAENPPPISSSSTAGLNANDVARFERFAEFAGKFARDVESGCSLWRHNFCNPIVRHLLEGKALSYRLEQGGQLRYVSMRSTRSEERGVEAVLVYYYKDSTVMMEGKYFMLKLLLRLSESTDVVGVAIRALQLLASQFKFEAESAMVELALLPALLHGIAHSCVPSWSSLAFQGWDSMLAGMCRRDPACCPASRNGLVGSSNGSVSSSLLLSHMFSEEVIYFYFKATSSSSSSNDLARRSSISRDRCPLVVSIVIKPHYGLNCMMHGGWARVSAAGNDVEDQRRDASIQQVSEMLKSDPISCFLCHRPQLTKYTMHWVSRHGDAWFVVEKNKNNRKSKELGGAT